MKYKDYFLGDSYYDWCNPTNYPFIILNSDTNMFPLLKFVNMELIDILSKISQNRWRDLTMVKGMQMYGRIDDKIINLVLSRTPNPIEFKQLVDATEPENTFHKKLFL